MGNMLHIERLVRHARRLAKLMRLGAPECIVVNEIVLGVRPARLAYGEKMDDARARIGIFALPSDFVAGMNLNPDDFTKKGKRVLNALDELEASKLNGSRCRIVHWAAVLMKAASDLAVEYLSQEAQDMICEEAERRQTCNIPRLDP